MPETYITKEFIVQSIGEKKPAKSGFYHIIKASPNDLVIWNKTINFQAGNTIRATMLSVSTKYGFQYRTNDNTEITVLADTHHVSSQVTESAKGVSGPHQELEVSLLLTCPHCGRNSSVRIK